MTCRAFVHMSLQKRSQIKDLSVTRQSISDYFYKVKLCKELYNFSLTLYFVMCVLKKTQDRAFLRKL